MDGIIEEVNEFMKNYEIATNTHNFDTVRQFISPDAIFWFSDGTYSGIDQIEKAFVNTWNRIKEEKYSIENKRWLMLDEKSAVCIYNFNWEGIIDGKTQKGSGRGTNVLSKIKEKWIIIHEHLSSQK